LNWLLEGYKWKILVDTMSQISGIEALSTLFKAFIFLVESLWKFRMERPLVFEVIIVK